MANNRQKLTVHQPAYYRVRVQGAVSESYCDIFGDMTIEEESGSSHQPVTTLTGQYLDQAALMGALNFLYDRRLPLLLVEYMPAEISESPEE